MEMNEALVHHGIKGQKWGVRRYQNKDGTLTPNGRKRYAKELDQERKNEYKRDSKSARLLSDDVLKAKIDRLKMEKEYKTLTEENTSPGKKFMMDIMRDSGKKVLSMVVAGTAAYALKAAMTKEFDVKEMSKYVAANPNSKK